MTDKQLEKTDFVGIVEFQNSRRERHFCILDLNGGMVGCVNLEGIGGYVASCFGKDFRDKINYEPSRGLDYSGAHRGLCARKYFALSEDERIQFEKIVDKKQNES